MLTIFQELFKFRALATALVKRHLKVRYRGSVLGFLWTFLNPLCLMIVYLLVFRYYIRFSTEENYAIFVFCGLLPWLWFTSSISEGTASIVNSGHLITKSMFPAHILPAVSVITNLINFVLSLPVLFIIMLIMKVQIPITVLALPLLILIQLLFTYGLLIGLAALNVNFRDVQYLVSNLLGFLFFLCPIVYPVSVIPEKFKFTLMLNPMALLASLYHQVLLQAQWPDLNVLGLLLAYSLITLIVGNFIYNRYRESFAECL